MGCPAGSSHSARAVETETAGLTYQCFGVRGEVVILTVQCFLSHFRSQVVRLMCDNSMAVSYISKQGETKLFRLTQHAIWLLRLCNRKGIWLVPVHLPGAACIKQTNTLLCVGQTILSKWAIGKELHFPVFSACGNW